jgi:ketosteroid isomerase-like protein
MGEHMNHALTTIRAREDALYAAMIAMDYAGLDDLLSDDLSYVHSTGVVESKAAYVAALPRGLYEYGAITRRDSTTQVFGTCAVTRGMIEMLVGQAGSAKNTIRLQHVLVWVKQAATWRLTLRQATRIPT